MIHVHRLGKQFARRTILHDINLSVGAAETISIIGPSGAGKSTLIRCLNLLERPDSGSIRIDDVEVGAERIAAAQVYRLRRKTGMVFQSFNLFSRLNALDNIAQALITVQKQDKRTARAQAYHYLEQVGLADKAEHLPTQLSGGQQQRVAIARALALKPKVLLMDEPTSALDPELVHEVLGIIRNITVTHRLTSIIVTHELAFARHISDRIVFMDEGRIIANDTPSHLFAHNAHPRIRAFLSRISGLGDFSI